ncbi:hypothetical protein SAMN05216582_1261, partial [Selenomonas ruminantium]
MSIAKIVTGGRTGECFFCGSDRLSAAKTGPT